VYGTVRSTRIAQPIAGAELVQMDIRDEASVQDALLVSKYPNGHQLADRLWDLSPAASGRVSRQPVVAPSLRELVAIMAAPHRSPDVQRGCSANVIGALGCAGRI